MLANLGFYLRTCAVCIIIPLSIFAGLAYNWLSTKSMPEATIFATMIPLTGGWLIPNSLSHGVLGGVFQPTRGLDVENPVCCMHTL